MNEINNVKKLFLFISANLLIPKNSILEIKLKILSDRLESNKDAIKGINTPKLISSNKEFINYFRELRK